MKDLGRKLEWRWGRPEEKEEERAKEAVIVCVCSPSHDFKMQWRLSFNELISGGGEIA